MACPDGQYFCNEKQKCMPIPKGSKVRKDGELVSEVAPPGFGHTKPDKEKGVKKGGTAAAFKRALDRGDFKGLPGSRTKKEKTADMFKIMWAQKKKGAKPHYKPGTDEKYKKYQEESLSVKDSKKLNKAAVLSYSDDPKDQHRARVRQAEIDFKDLMRQRAKKKKSIKESAVLDANTKIKKDEKKKKKEAELRRLLQHAIAVKKGQAESFEIDKSAHKTAQKKAKLRNLAKGNMNPNEKAAAEKKAGGPKLIGESYSDWKKKAADAIKKVVGKKEEKKAEKAMDAGAKAKRMLARKVHAKYVSGSEDNVPDDIRDHYEVSEGKKKGLWDNIHAKRKRGEKPAKPGDKDYPKTLNVEGAAWTKKSGKNPEGGLNEKGRKSYERENPGSDLKAPQPEGGSRKKSFCARMGGMKKKLTSAKTANDPDSRINKALRKWKC
mgnify:CR=1 FL=1|jgi:hypothetical protein